MDYTGILKLIRGAGTIRLPTERDYEAEKLKDRYWNYFPHKNAYSSLISFWFFRIVDLKAWNNLIM